MHNLQYLHDRKQKSIFLVLSLSVLVVFLALVSLYFISLSKNVIEVRTYPLFSLAFALSIIAWVAILIMSVITSMKCIIAKPITTISYATLIATTTSTLLASPKLLKDNYYLFAVFAIVLIILATVHLYLLNNFDQNHKHRLGKDLSAFFLTYITVSGLFVSSMINFRMTTNFYIVFYFFFVLLIAQLGFALHDIYYQRKRFAIYPILNLIQLAISIFLITELKLAFNKDKNISLVILSILVLFAFLSFIGSAYTSLELVKRHQAKARLERN